MLGLGFRGLGFRGWAGCLVLHGLSVCRMGFCLLLDGSSNLFCLVSNGSLKGSIRDSIIRVL